MNRRRLLAAVAALPALTVIPAMSLLSKPARAEQKPVSVEPLRKTNADWQRILPAERYRILFEEETERAYSSALDDETRAGSYLCAACLLPLFSSEHKYDSGTGWPSFTRPIDGHIGTRTDFKLIWPRTEYHCARCGGHQGHVFQDGPSPWGERWCNNGLALQFVPEGEPLPDLRT